MKEFRIYLIGVFLIANIVSSQESSCPNSDFESGTFSGWQGGTGYCCPININNSGIVSDRHTIMSGNETDPNTCGAVTVVAPGGLYSARLGNSNTGTEAEKLTYSLDVTASNTLFIYKYAVVLQDPGHNPEEQPRFQIRVLNAAGGLIDPVCGEYTVVAGSNIPGFKNCDGGVIYKDWTTVGLDLSSYIGQTITIEFATGDCSKGGHYGYAYVDAFCSPLKISSTFCTGSAAALLSAPIGFTYLWNTGETTQSINVNNPTAGHTYTCLLTSVTGCTVNISTDLTLFDPVADFNITNTCFNNAVFKNTTALPFGTVLDSFFWDFGDGTTSTIENPAHTYAAPGDYIVTFKISNALGCKDTTTRSVKVYHEPTANIAYAASFCNSLTSPQAVNLTGTNLYTGGVFSAPPGLNISATTGAIIPNKSTPGNYIVTYSIPTTNGCTVPSVTTTVTITGLPSAVISYNSPFCRDVSAPQPVRLSGTLAFSGGTFTSTAGLVINNSTGAIVPSASKAGTYLVTYTIPAYTGCPAIPVTTSVIINPLPEPILVNGDICLDPQGNLARSFTFDTGLANKDFAFQWFFNGQIMKEAIQGTYTATEIGEYSVIATNILTGCASSQIYATVVSAQMASDFIISVSDTFTENNILTVVVNGGTGPFFFQLDNESFQDSNVFRQLSSGIHIVSLKDDTNCTVISKQVTIMGYPKFFTPNNDGVNDYWNISYYNNFPQAHIRIFDRYGKLIKEIAPLGSGWDGTFDGHLLPAADYWFIVNFKEFNLKGDLESKMFKSHFSLIR